MYLERVGIEERKGSQHIRCEEVDVLREGGGDSRVEAISFARTDSLPCSSIPPGVQLETLPDHDPNPTVLPVNVRYVFSLESLPL